MIEEYAWCPMCRDGYTLNLQTRRVEKCTTCHGSSVITPKNICYCGKSCLVEKDGFDYCGDEKCYQGLVKDKDWKPSTVTVYTGRSTPQGSYTQNWSGRFSGPSCGADEDEDPAYFGQFS